MLSEQTSTFSFASKIIASAKEQINFEELSDEQLKLTMEEAIRTNRTLTHENEVLERYLQRKAPESLRKMSQILEAMIQAQKITKKVSISPGGALDTASNLSGSVVSNVRNRGVSSSTASLSSSARFGGSHQLSMAGGGGGGAPKRNTAGLKVTPAHRADLTEKEMDEMRKQFENFEKDMARKKTSLEAQLKEMKYRVAESEEMTAQFYNDIVNHLDPISNQVPMEKFLWFMNNQFKLAEHLIDKFNLKVITAKRLITEIKKEIARREERGETLQNIDYVKLEIENRHLFKETDIKQRILTTLMRRNSHFNRELKNHKQQLLDKMSLLKHMERNVILKEQETIDLQHTQMKMMHEIKTKANQLHRIKELQEKYETPSVEDFLDVQKQLQRAKSDVKTLTRKRKLQLVHINVLENRRKQLLSL